MKKKYVPVRVSGIVIQIAEQTEIEGYTKGIIETIIPDEMKMTDKEAKEWVKENNKRMVNICRFLNDE